MTLKEEIQQVSNMMDSMSDEEFIEELKKAGLDDCPSKNSNKTTYNPNFMKDNSLDRFFNFDKYETSNDSLDAVYKVSYKGAYKEEELHVNVRKDDFGFLEVA